MDVWRLALPNRLSSDREKPRAPLRLRGVWSFRTQALARAHKGNINAIAGALRRGPGRNPALRFVFRSNGGGALGEHLRATGKSHQAVLQATLSRGLKRRRRRSGIRSNAKVGTVRTEASRILSGPHEDRHIIVGAIADNAPAGADGRQRPARYDRRAVEQPHVDAAADSVAPENIVPAIVVKIRGLHDKSVGIGNRRKRAASDNG